MSYNKETGMYEGYIYLILNDIDPEQVYVGQTITTPNIRWNGHVYQISKHTRTDRLHNKMAFYGVKHFKMSTIEVYQFPSKEELISKLDEREIYNIKLFDSYYNGLNTTKGGRGTMDHMKRPVTQYSLDGDLLAEYDCIDDLHKIFDSVSAIYDCCNGNIKYSHGFIWRYSIDGLNTYPLPNDLEKQQARTRCKSLNPIDKYDYKGNKICTYKNITDAAISENVSYGDIFNCCIGKYVYVGTNIFRFCTDTFNTYKTFREKHKLVEQYDMTGNFLCVYESVREAGRKNYIPASAISAVCRGEKKSTHGYIWRYVEFNFIMPDFNHNGHCKKVYQYDKEGCLINIFDSIKEAHESSGVSENTIVDIAKGRKFAVYTPFVWSYVELTSEQIKSKCKSKRAKRKYN